MVSVEVHAFDDTPIWGRLRPESVDFGGQLPLPFPDGALRKPRLHPRDVRQGNVPDHGRGGVGGGGGRATPTAAARRAPGAVPRGEELRASLRRASRSLDSRRQSGGRAAPLRAKAGRARVGPNSDGGVRAGRSGKKNIPAKSWHVA